MSNQQPTDPRTIERLSARRVRVGDRIVVMPPEGHGDAWGAR